LSDLIKL